MKEIDDILKSVGAKEDFKSDLAKFYKKLNKAISSNNLQSIWQLSKIITRYTLN